MTAHNCIPYRALSLLVLAAGLAGCVSVPNASGPVDVFVSTSGLATYAGARFEASQLARRLERSDVDRVREIHVHLADVKNKALMGQIATDLHNKGYIHFFFLSPPKGSSEIVGEPETRIEAPVQNKATSQTPRSP